MTSIAGIPYQFSVVVIVVVSFAYLVTSGYWGAATVDVIQGLTRESWAVVVYCCCSFIPHRGHYADSQLHHCGTS